MTRHIDDYRHRDNSTQQPDTRPGHYYVSVVSGDRYGLLAGPFDTHQSALDRVDECRGLAERHDERACWYAFGTCRREDGNVIGQFNAELGL